MTTSKKKPAARDPMVAAVSILIEGKAFAEGDEIKGVSKDELDRAVSQRRAVPESAFAGRGVPVPEIGSEDETPAEDEGPAEGSEQ
jgi:hypothetical protein